MPPVVASQDSTQTAARLMMPDVLPATGVRRVCKHNVSGGRIRAFSFTRNHA